MMDDFSRDPYGNIDIDGGDAFYRFTSIPQRVTRNSLGICTQRVDYPISMVIVSGKFHMAFGNSFGDTGEDQTKFMIQWRPFTTVVYLVKVTYTIDKTDVIYNYAFINDPTGNIKHGKSIRIQVGVYPEVVITPDQSIDKTLIIMHNSHDHAAMLSIAEVTTEYPETVVFDVQQSLGLSSESMHYMLVLRDSNIVFT
jgi:hypothetical protein